jgi:hypothetical protein
MLNKKGQGMIEDETLLHAEEDSEIEFLRAEIGMMHEGIKERCRKIEEFAAAIFAKQEVPIEFCVDNKGNLHRLGVVCEICGTHAETLETVNGHQMCPNCKDDAVIELIEFQRL